MSAGGKDAGHELPPAEEVAISTVSLPVHVLRDYDDVRTVMRLAREGAGLSQSELAQQRGYVPATISHREAGKRIVLADELLAALQHLGWKLAVIPPAATKPPAEAAPKSDPADHTCPPDDYRCRSGGACAAS